MPALLSILTFIAARLYGNCECEREHVCLENRSCFEYRMHVEGGSGLYRQCLCIQRAIKLHSRWGKCDRERFRLPPPSILINCTTVVAHTGLHINMEASVVVVCLLLCFLQDFPCFSSAESVSSSMCPSR